MQKNTLQKLRASVHAIRKNGISIRSSKEKKIIKSSYGSNILTRFTTRIGYEMHTYVQSIMRNDTDYIPEGEAAATESGFLEQFRRRSTVRSEVSLRKESTYHKQNTVLRWTCARS